MTNTKSIKELPYLIVGQGIAGSMLAWFLAQAGTPFIIIDNNHKSSASKIAAGIINPITGRRFVKSWMIEDFLPFARQTYQAIEKELAVQVWKDMDIIRFFLNNAEGNNWLSKTTWEGYDKFLKKEKEAAYLNEIIYDEMGYGTVMGAKVNLGVLVKAFKKYFQAKEQLRTESFEYELLEIEANYVKYKDLIAKKVIFCEGYKSAQNPWLNHLPFESAKGEALILRIPSLQTPDIIKKHFFIVPLENDLFWFGSNYEWDDLTDEPTQIGKDYLVDALKDILKVDYEIVNHLAAVRPVLKDRRPALGLHPTHKNIAILNGMGTKGTSIAPYWAKEMVAFLTEKKEIPAEVDVQRFKVG
ncbi:MAG: NAD(P)/FAD-dependent oxidoreductase [Saprospiraceae bacterium]